MYRIESENSANPNAVFLPQTDREVYLFDILSAFLVNEVGINYSYFAHINSKGEAEFISLCLYSVRKIYQSIF